MRGSTTGLALREFQERRLEELGELGEREKKLKQGGRKGIHCLHGLILTSHKKRDQGYVPDLSAPVTMYCGIKSRSRRE